ncbi:asparagine--tRNA ligase [Candidatus Pantoea carbekii]|uniref:Asparagine--tRNA ligase n=1 Tax=Candidatus Pantoea carbekii TaxID=1235990 RepID=U3U3E6_9GAMM|nr:asparagine--tRNA ligase [Candidatus Pantoea carbekii]AKC32154.1 asparaginyl-tRNA synthetase [Candidatus Pantoea carbekii]BAO00681.1 asparaginyl-tRNA synthetase [Candidatus Pantoea carbekii]
MKVVIANIIKGYIAIGTEVVIHGWIRTRRDSKSGISFLTVYDGSCFESIQVIVNNFLNNYQNEILRLTAGCAVIVNGELIKSLGQGQEFEIKADKVHIVGWVENPDTYPISAKRHTIEYLREVAHLRPRTNLIGAVTRVRHVLAHALHHFLNENGYLWIATPLITTLDTEGAGEMFRVSTLNFENMPRNFQGQIDFSQDFFGKETFLTVSGQLNAETYACALSKIYTFGPTFRAENSNTTRHLSEFWMLELEVAFATLNDISSLAEVMLKNAFKVVLAERYDDLMFFNKYIDKAVISRLEQFIKTDFIHLNYADAIKILLKSGENFEDKLHWGDDLSSEHERYLTEKYFKAPVVVKNYPKHIKAFYMRLNEDNQTVAAMDILVPGIGEIIGGSQREERLAVLDSRLIETGLDKDKYWWYRDLRRYGTVPHAGFGLGFDRLVSYVTGIKNIRDVIPFPRTPRNANY